MIAHPSPKKWIGEHITSRETGGKAKMTTSSTEGKLLPVFQIIEAVQIRLT
jgi:hypothetical protein